MSRIPGFTSTGSKRPDAVFGELAGGEGLPQRMTRSRGCRVEDERGRSYVDYVMGLGAVALGYAHPEVTAAVRAAADEGVVGPLPPVLEEEVADIISRLMPFGGGRVSSAIAIMRRTSASASAIVAPGRSRAMPLYE